MKAVKLIIGFREWSKLPEFVKAINAEGDLLAYEIDNTTALLVAPGEYGLAWMDILNKLTPYGLFKLTPIDNL